MSSLRKIFKISKKNNETISFTDFILDKTFLRFFPKKVEPNHLTAFRYFTIPLIAYLFIFEYYFFGLISFSISVFTDALDGAMARTRNKITNWGKINDPLADKLLICVTGLILITRYIGIQIIIAIIMIEIFTIALVINLYYKKKEEIGAKMPGKIKMLFQSFGLIALMIYLITLSQPLLIFSTILFYLAIFFGSINLLFYQSL